MSWKFNPPPGWPPQPEGWQPPPGWAPDPSWPPAPAGWQFWVPATGTPPATGAPEPGPSVHEAPTSVVSGPPPQSGPPQSGPPQSGPPGPAYPASPYAAGAYPASPYAAGAYPASPYAAGPPPGPYPPTLAAPAAGPAGGGKPWHQRWWAMAGTGLAVLLVGCLGGSAVALVTDSDEEALPPNPPPTTGGPTATESPDEPDNPGGSSGGLRAGEERSGEGPTIIPLDFSGADHHTLTLSYSGEGFFSARLVDTDGEYVESLGSGSDGYTGVFPADLGVFFSAEPAAVDITDAGEGTWTVAMADLNDSPVWPEQTTGEGTVVLRIDPAALNDVDAINGTHDGEANFIVWAYSEGDGPDTLLFNEIGEFSGESSDELAGSPVLLSVKADGGWTVEPS